MRCRSDVGLGGQRHVDLGVRDPVGVLGEERHQATDADRRTDVVRKAVEAAVVRGTGDAHRRAPLVVAVADGDPMLSGGAIEGLALAFGHGDRFARVSVGAEECEIEETRVLVAHRSTGRRDCVGRRSSTSRAGV